MEEIIAKNVFCHRKGLSILKLLFLFGFFPIILCAQYAIFFETIKNYNKNEYGQFLAGVLIFISLFSVYYFVISILAEETKSVYKVELKEFCLIGYYKNGRTVSVDYENILDMREPGFFKKDWWISSSAVISEKNGRKTFISNQIEEFGLCMETIRNNSPAVRTFSFPTWTTRTIVWGRKKR